MWSGSFLFSRSNKSAASGPTAVQAQQSPFGGPRPSNAVHGASGGVVPPVLLEEKRVPKFYKDCIAQCGAHSTSQSPNTGLVYNLMVASQLPKDVLSDIWHMVSRTMPGQLTRPEFFSCLALIALAQKGESISALSGVTTLPIPHLQSFTAGGVGLHSQKNGSKPNQAFVESGMPQLNTRTAPIQNSRKQMQDNIVPSKSNKNAQFLPATLVAGQSNENELPTNGVPAQQSNFVDLLDGLSFDQPVGTNSAAANMADPFDQGRRTSVIYDLLDVDMSKSRVPDDVTQVSPAPEDPYAVLRNDPQQDEYIEAWQQCVNTAVTTIDNAVSLLERSEPITREILFQEKGLKFVQSIGAMASVLNRVALSIHTHRPKETVLIRKAQQCLIAWKKIAAHPLIAKALHDIPFHSNSDPNPIATCALCLQSIAQADSFNLEFGGSHYHSSCANFWVNLVNLGLPRLEKPSI
uniref:EH domain-containing protein n=1 Tax=Panagrellus redivivus TaxID=6233 RepID=A0A7E4UX37_PANRE